MNSFWCHTHDQLSRKHPKHNGVENNKTKPFKCTELTDSSPQEGNISLTEVIFCQEILGKYSYKIDNSSLDSDIKNLELSKPTPAKIHLSNCSDPTIEEIHEKTNDINCKVTASDIAMPYNDVKSFENKEKKPFQCNICKKFFSHKIDVNSCAYCALIFAMYF